MSTFSKIKVESAENKGRKVVERLFNKLGITKYKFSEDQFEVYDCAALNKEKQLLLIEIKHRDSRYEQYNDMLLEEKKYRSLLKECKKFNAIPVYINTYDKGKTVKVANLNDIADEFETGYQQKSELGDRNIIKKSLTYVKNFININL